MSIENKFEKLRKLFVDSSSSSSSNPEPDLDSLMSIRNSSNENLLNVIVQSQINLEKAKDVSYLK